MATQSTVPGYIGDKADIAARLKRIEGQVRGIERMVENERYCIDILTQISAIQAGPDKVGLRLLEQHAAHWVIGPDDSDARATQTGEMIDARVHGIAYFGAEAASAERRVLGEELAVEPGRARRCHLRLDREIGARGER